MIRLNLGGINFCTIDYSFRMDMFKFLITRRAIVKEFYIAWWNVENLFDHNDAERSEKLKRVIGRELDGWNDTVLDKKLSQLSKIILQMNGGHGPDILGVCEVENIRVLNKLVSKISTLRKYKIAHSDTKDRRGIDTAFIYDADKFKADRTFSHYIVKRNATRDLFQVNMTIKKSDQQLMLIGNHWPSRMGGQFASEPYRIIAGETLAYFHKRITETNDEGVAIMAMGDFNDEPFNRSMTEHALAINNEAQVLRARNPKFYNLMWQFLKGGQGTHYYGSTGSILDHILVSREFLRDKSRLSIKPDTIRIERFVDMMKRNKPRRFGRPSKRSSYDKGGFSDHFPISVIIEFDETANT